MCINAVDLISVLVHSADERSDVNRDIGTTRRQPSGLPPATQSAVANDPLADEER